MRFLINFLLALCAALGVAAQDTGATSTQTFYTTVSLLRVAMPTSTSNSSSIASASAKPTASSGLSNFTNATGTWSSSILPSGSATIAAAQPSHSTNSAVRMGMDVIGMAAIAGLVGMVAM